jgi:hypothetical protein
VLAALSLVGANTNYDSEFWVVNQRLRVVADTASHCLHTHEYIPGRRRECDPHPEGRLEKHLRCSRASTCRHQACSAACFLCPRPIRTRRAGSRRHRSQVAEVGGWLLSRLAATVAGTVWQLPSVATHTYTHTNTHIQSHIHTHRHQHRHRHRHTHIHTHPLRHAMCVCGDSSLRWPHLYTHTQTHTHTLTHTHTQTDTSTDTDTDTDTYIHTHIQTCNVYVATKHFQTQPCLPTWLSPLPLLCPVTHTYLDTDTEPAQKQKLNMSHGGEG